MGTRYWGELGEIEAEAALKLPVGQSFRLIYEYGQTAEVEVLRTGADSWQGRRAGFQANITREDGMFNPHQAGRSRQSTLHAAMEAKLGPFRR